MVTHNKQFAADGETASQARRNAGRRLFEPQKAEIRTGGNKVGEGTVAKGVVMKCLSKVVGFALVVCFAGIGNAQTQGARVLVGATITDPSREPSQFVGTVVIDGERIARVGPIGAVAIPRGAERIELNGKFLIPGLIDAHVHFFGGVSDAGFLPSDFHELLEYPRWGVTSVFDAANDTDSFKRAKRLTNEDGARRARYFGVGAPFTSALNATPTLDQIRASLDALRAADVDGVMVIHSTSGTMVQPLPTFVYPPDVLMTILNESRARSLPVVVQASNRRTAQDALDAGAHALMHAIYDVPFDDDFLDSMRRAGAFYVPTHALFESRADAKTWSYRLEDFDRGNRIPEATFESMRAVEETDLTTSSPLREKLPILRENLRRIQQAGIPIALGTDTGVPGSAVGLSSQIELALYVEAGLTAEQALRSATANAARMIGVFDRLGSIEEGKLADLVVLSENPLEDIRNIREIEAVFLGGVLLQ